MAVSQKFQGNKEKSKRKFRCTTKISNTIEERGCFREGLLEEILHFATKADINTNLAAVTSQKEFYFNFNFLFTQQKVPHL